MENIVNISDYFRFIFALGVVLGLVFLLAFLMRRFGSGFPSSLAKGRRLGIVESLHLDAKHRLVLIKRDGVEHLILLGHGSDLLIDANFCPPEVSEEETEKTTIVSETPPLNKIPKQHFKNFLAHMKSIQK